MGPDGYRRALLSHAGMPELRNDPRFVPLCAWLGLLELWLAAAKWPDCVDEVPYDFRAECEKPRHIPIEEFGFGAVDGPEQLEPGLAAEGRAPGGLPHTRWVATQQPAVPYPRQPG